MTFDNLYDAVQQSITEASASQLLNTALVLLAIELKAARLVHKTTRAVGFRASCHVPGGPPRVHGAIASNGLPSHYCALRCSVGPSRPSSAMRFSSVRYRFFRIPDALGSTR